MNIDLNKFLSIPTFDVSEDLIGSIYGPVIDKLQFSERILEFVENNLNGTNIETTLCYLMESDGTIMTAQLTDEGYLKSLEQCMVYYSSEEKYEKCNEIKNLIKKYELR